jgi:hypothetical protein
LRANSNVTLLNDRERQTAIFEAGCRLHIFVNDRGAARTGICWQTNPPLWNNHPPTGYPSSLRLLNTFKTAYPLHRFVTHAFPVHQVDKAMAQAFRYRRLQDRRYEHAVSTPKRTLAEGVGCAAGGH